MIREFSDAVFSRKKFIKTVILLNVIGFFLGLYYYGEQLLSSSPALWILIIDCPLAVLLFSFVAIKIVKNTSTNNSLVIFTSVYLIKFGVWTLITEYLYWENYMVSNIDMFIGISGFILHVGMILEGVVLLPKIKPRIKDFIVPLILVLLNDISDYFFGTLTWIPDTYMSMLRFEAFISTVFTFILIFVYSNFLSFHEK